jgi:anthranilate synthase component 2
VKILVVDNFDSFTFNLVHYLEGLNCEVSVFRNTEIPYESVLNFDKIVISPGPGLPYESAELMDFIDQFHDKIPILGVCLGMQALAVYFGENLKNLERVKHGVSEKIKINNHASLFKSISAEIEVGLYHSWAVELKSDVNFIPLAYSKEDVLMAFQHKSLPLFGVQFHPESILTEFGKEILLNFIQFQIL